MAGRSTNNSGNRQPFFSKRLGEVLGIAGSIIAILGVGFGAGIYVTYTQYENKITNINLEYQSKLSEEREKGRKEGIEEMRQREEQLKSYLILFKNNDQKK